MIGKLSTDEAIHLLTTATGRELVRDALNRPNHLDVSGLAALKSALDYPLDEVKAREIGRMFLLSHPQHAGLVGALSKLFLHSPVNLSNPQAGAQVIERSFETIVAADTKEFLQRIEAHRNVIKFMIRFSGIEEFRAQFLYHVNILARKLFEEETGELGKGKKEYELRRSDFEKMITKLYAVNTLGNGDMSIYDLSRLLPYELDTVSNRYKLFREDNTTFYAYGPKAVQLVQAIAKLDPNNRLVIIGSDKKKGGSGQSSGGSSSQGGETGPAQAPGGGNVVSFPQVMRHAGHAQQKSAQLMYGRKHANDADVAAGAASNQSISAMIAAGIVVPLKPVRG